MIQHEPNQIIVFTNSMINGFGTLLNISHNKLKKNVDAEWLDEEVQMGNICKYNIENARFI